MASVVTVSEIRNTNIELDSTRISDDKIQQHIDYADTECKMYGLTDDSLKMATYHKAIYDTMRDVLKAEELEEKEEKTKFFGVDPDYHYKNFKLIINNFGSLKEKNTQNGIAQIC